MGLIYWLLLFSIITDYLGKGFGLSFLFLSPEYQEEVSVYSFAILGFALGGFTMAFHSYSYTKLASHFPFLAMVNKPFLKFCINNSLVPVVFILVLIYEIIRFQYIEEFAKTSDVFLYILGLVLGMSFFIAISILFFFRKNKNVFELKHFSDTVSSRRLRWMRIQNGRNYKARGRTEQLYFYFGRGLRIMQCRSTRHYQTALLQKVFIQNRISTSLFEVSTIAAFLLLGFLGGSRWMDVPAASSIVLLLTIVLMVFNALLSWFRWYTVPLILAIFISINWLSGNTKWFHFETEAIGMDYSSKAVYSYDRFSEELLDSARVEKDLNAYIRSLENWKKNTGEEKPILFIVNTSGGGSRSAAWVYWVLSQMDQSTRYNFTKHTAMITGASGGMVGGAFYRGLYAEYQNGDIPSTCSNTYYEQITSDILNKMSFAASTNDIFVRYRTSYKNESSYHYTRAIAFEEDMNENTGFILDKPFGETALDEKDGKIPVMLFSPCIVNDGRRITFSTMGTRFLNPQHKLAGSASMVENIDARALLGKDQVDKVKFSSVLRMNATFPLVLPMTTLPTEPKIQVMDAGTRDNFGTKTTVNWMMALQDWIAKETSGVVIIKIRDTKKVFDKENTREFSFFNKFLEPFGNLFSNFPRTQDFDQDELLNAYASRAPFPLSVVSFNLRETKTERISLSWHLTKKERELIKQAIKKPSNQQAKEILLKHLEKRKRGKGK
jgi:hypothetical protein